MKGEDGMGRKKGGEFTLAVREKRDREQSPHWWVGEVQNMRSLVAVLGCSKMGEFSSYPGLLLYPKFKV